MATHQVVESEETQRIDIVPKTAHTATLVWLHGLGDSCEGFFPYFSDPKLIFPSLKIVLPTAPSMPVTVNHCHTMNSWYDVRFAWDTSIHPTALQSADQICSILREEAQSTSRLFLGGISQGGAMALLTGYSRYNGPLAGIIALSSYTLDIEVPEERKSIPGLIYHGDRDQTINIDFSKSTYDRTLRGVNYTYKVIPGLVHWVSTGEMGEVKEWIQALAR